MDEKFDLGRKIHPDIENPIDDQIMNLCQQLAPICYKNGITPNGITIYRIILCLFVYRELFFTNNIFIPIVGSGLFYFFDCLDGYLARSHNQVTVMGDYLDHYGDLFNFLLFIIYILKRDYQYKNELLIAFVILTYLSLVHLGLQQKHYKKTIEKIKEQNTMFGYLDDELLDSLNSIHNLKEEDIKKTRFFGTGTLCVFMLFMIYWIQTH